MKNEYYQELISLPEIGELKNALKRWNLLTERMGKKNVVIGNLLPDLFCISYPGIGKSHLLQLLSKYLQSASLVSFTGESDFFEFKFEYCSPVENFDELKRFVESMANAAGFRSEYRGVVCIELDEWLGHISEKYFRVFMEYLEEKSDDLFIIFSVDSSESNVVAEMQSFLSMFFRIETVKLKKPSVEEYCSYLSEYLRKSSLTLSESAGEIIKESIKKMYFHPMFDGYKSIRRLGMDITYEKYLGKSFDDTVLNEEDVERFVSSGEYISTMIATLDKRRSIGFCIGGSEK